MAIEKKETVKATETKTAKVETPKAAAPVAAEAAKVVEKKAAAPKKAAAEKKAAAPKAAAEKTVAAPKPTVKKADPKTKVVVEFAGKQIVTKDIVAAATKAFTKANKGVTIKSIEVYVKPEEQVAYYVVNGQGADEYKVNL